MIDDWLIKLFASARPIRIGITMRYQQAVKAARNRQYRWAKKTAPSVLQRSGRAGSFVVGTIRCFVGDLPRSRRGFSVFEGSKLFAGANRAGQAAVIHSIGSVPQRLTEFHATSQNFDLLWASRRRIGRDELVVLVGDEIFIVTVTQNGFENVLAGTHIFSFNFSLRLSSVACGVKLGVHRLRAMALCVIDALETNFEL